MSQRKTWFQYSTHHCKNKAWHKPFFPNSSVVIWSHQIYDEPAWGQFPSGKTLAWRNNTPDCVWPQLLNSTYFRILKWLSLIPLPLFIYWAKISWRNIMPEFLSQKGEITLESDIANQVNQITFQHLLFVLSLTTLELILRIITIYSYWISSCKTSSP